MPGIRLDTIPVALRFVDLKAGFRDRVTCMWPTRANTNLGL